MRNGCGRGNPIRCQLVPFPYSLFIRFLLIWLPLAGLSPAAGLSGSVTVAWNANTESNLSGYRVLYGTSSSNLDRSLVVGTVTTAVLSGLETGATYYCAVQAFNTSSLYSSLSPTLSFVVPEVIQPLITVQQGSTGTALSSGGRITLITGGGTESLLIQNSGTASLTGLKVTVDGANAVDFPTTAPAVTSLAAGESTPVYVQFRPAGTGPKTATLHVTGDGLASFDIVLSGDGIPVPEIVVEQPLGLELASGQATVHFNHSVIGESGNTETFTIRNIGTAALNGLTLRASGDASGDYLISQPELTSLAPEATTTFQVTFRPTVSGIRVATLHLASNDPDESPFDIVLEGNSASVPEIGVSLADSTSLTDGTSTVGFGNVALGEIAETQILTITNT
ncbi:MAG: choice-of-anchor D domain-containing protein, partial [Verrucomicrobiaceae bacterium]